MVRDLKFRAWHKGIKEMLNVYAINQQTHAGLEYCGVCLGWFGDNHQVEFTYDQVDWMQYTGLKDKNGKEIYEGDIIKHGESIRFIEVRGCNYCATRMEKTETILLSFCGSPLVIGNIYSNHELIKS